MIPPERLWKLWTNSDFKYADFARAVEREALEEAAKVCEDKRQFRLGNRQYPQDIDEALDRCAAAIRALKEKT